MIVFNRVLATNKQNAARLRRQNEIKAKWPKTAHVTMLMSSAGQLLVRSLVAAIDANQ